MNTPKCKICGDQHQLDQFDSSAWIQYYSKNKDGSKVSEDNLLWICPQCSEDIGFTDLREESEARMKLIGRIQGALSVFDELAQEKRQGF